MSLLEDLLAREEEAWASFADQVARLSEEDRDRDGVVPGWSAKDLVWHCAKWAERAAGHLEALGAGGPVETLEGQPEEVWMRMNDDWAAESKALSFSEAHARAEASRERVRTALAALNHVEGQAREWFSEETFEHYEEHTAEIRRFADGLVG